MRRNLAKRGYAGRRRSHGRRWQTLGLLAVFAAIFAGIGYMGYQVKRATPFGVAVTTHLTDVKTWFANRKNKLHNDIEKVKRIAAKKDPSEQQIHFEFYTALPNMGMRAADQLAENDVKPVVERKKISRSAKQVDVAQTSSEQADASAQTLAQAAHPVVNSEDLERDFANEVKQESYVVQLGAFQTFAAAERYRVALPQTGFTTRVVRAANAVKETYHVQLGPFTDKGRAKSAQAQLERKGINCFLHKIAES